MHASVNDLKSKWLMDLLGQRMVDPGVEAISAHPLAAP